MRADLACKRLLLAAVALVGVVDAAVIAGSARADSQPPIVTVGPASDPNGSATASGAAGSGGQTDACVNGQHSGADPSSTDPTGAASVSDSSCQKSGASTTGGAGGAQAAANGRTVSSAGAAQTGTSQQNSTASHRSGAAAVAAANARGVQITRIKYITNQVRTKNRLRLIVTVRDIDGRLIRDAIVLIRPLPSAKQTVTATLASFSNPVGQASLAVPVATQMRGKRLLFLVTARTPKAHTLAIGSVRLPAAKARIVAVRA